MSLAVTYTWEEPGLIERLAPSRDAIQRLEKELRKYEQIDLPLTHTFAPGSYGRTIKLPKGCIVVGKIHKHAHLNVVSRGKVTVVTEFGPRHIDAMQAPVVFTSDAGSKRALCCHEETWWTTVHLTEETDLEKIEAQIIAPTYEELDQFMLSECVRLLGSHP